VRFNGFRGWLQWGVKLGEYDDAFLVLDLLNQIRMNSIRHPAEEAGAVPEDQGHNNLNKTSIANELDIQCVKPARPKPNTSLERKTRHTT